MGLWADSILPRIIDRGMRNDFMGEHRHRAIRHDLAKRRVVTNRCVELDRERWVLLANLSDRLRNVEPYVLSGKEENRDDVDSCNTLIYAELYGFMQRWRDKLQKCRIDSPNVSDLRPNAGSKVVERGLPFGITAPMSV